MGELESANIESPLLEHSIEFGQPAFVISERWNAMNSAMIGALGAAGLTPAGISFRSDPKNLGEVRVEYRLPDGRFMLSVGIETVILTITDPTQSEMDRHLQLAGRGCEAIQRVVQIPFTGQKIVLIFHVKSVQRTNIEITRRFFPVAPPRLSGEPMDVSGFWLKSPKSQVLIEPSTRVPNGLFVRLERHFSADQSLTEIASNLISFQGEVLRAMGFVLEGENVRTSK